MQSARAGGTVLALILVCGLWSLAHAQGGPGQIWMTPVLEHEAAHPGTTARVALQVTLEEGYHVNSDTPLDEFLIPTVWALQPPEGISVGRLAYPEPVMFQQGDALELEVFESEFVIGAELELADDLEPGTYPIESTFRYQACDDYACYAPETKPVSFSLRVVSPAEPLGTASSPGVFDGLRFTDAPAPSADRPVDARDTGDAASGDASVLADLGRFRTAATAGGYMDEEAFLDFLDAAESGQAQKGWFEDRGPLAILALVLIGGLALNLTPCVLPMIPINLAIIGAGSQAGSRGRGFALGAAYGAGMAVVYGVLGLIVILTAGNFGTVNASPWFNLGIAALFVVLGLAMFDVIHIDFSGLQSRVDVGGSKGSFLLATGMGGVAALLAGACVAPVVIQVIVFASSLYATGTTAALALPFLLGVGMAIPWPLAGAGLSLLPEPGPWMVRVKQAFGVFILATAAYYAWIGYGLVAQRWVDPDAVVGSVAELAEGGWHTSLDSALAEAEAENKPVLVDVWASWCKNCLVMDETTMRHPDVRARLEDYVKVKFRAEDPGATPAREVMERLDAIGLPAYGVLLPPGLEPGDFGSSAPAAGP